MSFDEGGHPFFGNGGFSFLLRWRNAFRALIGGSVETTKPQMLWPTSVALRLSLADNRAVGSPPEKPAKTVVTLPVSVYPAKGSLRLSRQRRAFAVSFDVRLDSMFPPLYLMFPIVPIPSSSSKKTRAYSVTSIACRFAS